MLLKINKLNVKKCQSKKVKPFLANSKKVKKNIRYLKTLLLYINIICKGVFLYLSKNQFTFYFWLRPQIYFLRIRINIVNLAEIQQKFVTLFSHYSRKSLHKPMV